jgi:hypothetical protein
MLSVSLLHSRMSHIRRSVLRKSAPGIVDATHHALPLSTHSARAMGVLRQASPGANAIDAFALLPDLSRAYARVCARERRACFGRPERTPRADSPCPRPLTRARVCG